MDITISEQFAPYQKVDPATNEKYITREDICKAINLPSLEFLDDLLERCKLEQTGKLGCLSNVGVVVIIIIIILRFDTYIRTIKYLI